MYIRKKKNKSGVVSIQIIDKSTGAYSVLQTIGSSKDPDIIEALYKQAEKEIASKKGQSSLFFNESQELDYINSLMDNISTLSLVGPELLIGKLFNEVGFNEIEDELFRHLVITRLIYPVSKLKTTDYLLKYKGLSISVYSIYRYLDKLHQHQIELVKSISLKHTLKVLDQTLSVVFYDVTTLYFEASDEDDFRKTGFSKDGKHQQPQIVLGLLVSEGGYPLDYDVFEGNKYEGDTMLPVIEHFIKKHSVEQLIVVANAGLLSKKNINLLKQKNYQYILGARIKNESNAIKKSILKLQLKDKESTVVDKEDGSKLIISYKTNRAKKDAANRKKGYEKLKLKVQSGKLSKTNINNKGYNKYLKLEGETIISIDDEKYKDDAKWDWIKRLLNQH